MFQDCIVKLNSSYFNIFSDNYLKNYWNKVDKIKTIFNQTDDKWYFVIWRGDKNNEWNINKFYNSSGDSYYAIDEKSQIHVLFKSNEYFFGIKEFYNDKSKNKIIIFKNEILNVIKEFNIYDIDNNYIKSVYRWRIKGNPTLPEINSNTGEIKWKDFNQYKLIVKNNDISENPIYQLETNYFNWLSVTNELETNNIPSLIPVEIKLSDGEYGKYLTNLIVSNDKIEKYLNYFSQWYSLIYSKARWLSVTKDLVEDSIKINFYKHEKLFNLNQIEISGIRGHGNYDVTIFTEKEKIIINNLELFNKNNEKLSLITLEI